jgi:hypothetical protein
MAVYRTGMLATRVSVQCAMVYAPYTETQFTINFLYIKYTSYFNNNKTCRQTAILSYPTKADLYSFSCTSR